MSRIGAFRYQDIYLYQCLHGNFESANECLNSAIYKEVPKNFYISLPALMFSFYSGLYDAVCQLIHNGNRGPWRLEREPGVKPGSTPCKLALPRPRTTNVSWSLPERALVQLKRGQAEEYKLPHEAKQIMMQLQRSSALSLADFGFGAPFFYSCRFVNWSINQRINQSLVATACMLTQRYVQIQQWYILVSRNIPSINIRIRFRVVHGSPKCIFFRTFSFLKNCALYTSPITFILVNFTAHQCTASQMFNNIALALAVHLVRTI